MASQTTIPFSVRADLQFHRSSFQRGLCWVVKDPVRFQFFRLTEQQYCLLHLLDGKRDLEQIQQALRQHNPIFVSHPKQLQRTIMDFYQQGLVRSNRPRQGESLNFRGDQMSWKEITRAARNLLFIKFPGLDPTKVLNAGYPIARWLFHPMFVACSVAFVLYSWMFMLANAMEFQQQLPSIESLLTFKTTIAIWIVIGMAKILHELGHAFACRHHRGECHQIGLAFLVFSPCLYCDVSDSWTLRSRWQRIAIALAGVYVELVIGTVAFFCWWHSAPGNFHDVCFLVFAATAISSLLFNLNPLLRLDGYYILGDLIALPNLRQRADERLDRIIATGVLGIQLDEQEHVSRHESYILAFYSVASLVYRVFLVGIICFMLYAALKPWRLEFLGFILAGVSVATGTSAWLQRIKRTVRRSKKPTSKTNPLRPWLLATASGLCLTIFIALPLPLKVNALARVEYRNSHRFYAHQDLQLQKVNTRPGTWVRAGTLIMRLADFESEAKLKKLSTRRQVLEMELRKYTLLVDPQSIRITEQNLKSIDSEMTELRAQTKEFGIRAPFDGLLIEPLARGEAETNGKRLRTWSGVPIDVLNEGAVVQKGTHLFTIVPKTNFQAVLQIEPRELPQVEVGQAVDLKLKTIPRTTLSGTIERVSKGTIESSIPSATQSLDLDGWQSEGGIEENRDQFLATVHLEDFPRNLIYGATGSAKVAVDKQTLVQWIWRSVKSSFKFDIRA